MAFRYLYNGAMCLADMATGAVAPLLKDSSGRKLSRFLNGRKGLLKDIKTRLKKDDGKPTVWFHAASLGEFGIARPLIEKMKERANIVATFFSPSGYDVISRRRDQWPNVFYLPWDTPGNARKFLDTVKPDRAVFMVSELWHNYLRELRKRDIPTFLVSALVRDDSSWFRWYAKDYLADLRGFDTIFTVDDTSVKVLRSHGFDSVENLGDPLFDNAVKVREQEYENPVVVRFKGDSRLMVGGSLHHDSDLDITAALANANRDVKFLIVPHEITPGILEDIRKKFDGKTLLYSECDDTTDFSDVQGLVIDYVGDLAKLYRYGDWAYVGGGFTAYLHSVIEPLVYGLPVAFGPNLQRKVTPGQMMERGVGMSVKNDGDLQGWFAEMQSPEILDRIKRKAEEYFRENSGAADKISGKIWKD